MPWSKRSVPTMPSPNGADRLYGASVLECIHTDLTVTKALEFLSQEEEGDIKVWLGQVLVRQFAFEAHRAAASIDTGRSARP